MGHDLNRTVRTTWDAASVFSYLLDFTSAEDWDAGTVSCTLLSGDGGLGTTYRNVSRFLGSETTLDYVVASIEGTREFVITGKNKTVTSKDTITVTPSGSGAEVHYRAEMSFAGIAGVISPLLTFPLKKLADDTAAKLKRVLDGKAGAGSTAG